MNSDKNVFTFPGCRALTLLKAITAIALTILLITPGHAENSSGVFAGINDYFANWFERADATMAEQPHWAPPVATTTPRLQEILRYDIMWQSPKGGHELVNYGSAKGLEFIPAENFQFIVGIPPYETENTSPRKEGWGDQMFLMKYRFATGNEENGNYILTGFMGVTVPNGSSAFSTKHFVYCADARGRERLG